ncbi:uncharacterized protein [Primulina huaijiensis]|uniref:uncharacterized protein n=1 Tax=Primulina huaijiensis TaxID=1492673 RepID=UPI003CC7851D
MNRCHQDEISITRRKAKQASKTSSSLGPRGKSFKNSVSSSSSDSGWVHSFCGKKLQCGHCGDVLMSVSTPMGQEVLAKRLVVDCLLEFDGKYLSVNLMILVMEYFDCIMGIDLLTKYRMIIDCYQRLVQFHLEGYENCLFFDERTLPPMPAVFAVKAQRALAKRGEGYLIYVVEISKNIIDVKNITVVDEFLDVFSDEIHGFLPERKVQAEIELVPGTTLISRVPYRLGPMKMKELKQ